MIVLPGGMENALHLSSTTELIQKLKSQKEAGKWIAAICASPSIVFKEHGLIIGETATCYPSLPLDGSTESTEDAVISNNVVTSRAPGIDLAYL